MIQYLAPVVVVLIGAILLVTVQRGREAAETRIAWLAFAAHIVASLAQLAITLYWYGGGDALNYARGAERVAVLFDLDFATFGWEMFRVFMHEDGHLPLEIMGEGSSTGTMVAIASFVLYPLGGSLLAGCLTLSLAALFSRLLLMRVFVTMTPPEHHRIVWLASLLVPSVTFWGGVIAKETVALIGLGPLLWGVARVFRPGASLRAARRILYAVVAALGALLVWSVKPYVLVAFVVGAGAWWYVENVSAGRAIRVRFRHLVGAGGVAVLVVYLVGQVFPDYSLDSIAEQAADLQMVGTRITGGSSYSLGSGGARSFLGQLAFAPLALLFALFRPVIFESRNVLMFVNSLETTWITYIVARAFYRRGWRQLLLNVQGSPLLAFSATFVLVLGLGVGIATTNLGTLTRYRMPMVTFYVLLVLLWERLGAQPAPAPLQASARSAPPRRRRPRGVTPEPAG